MKWGVIGIFEVLADGSYEWTTTAARCWGVRLFDEYEDARQFAAGLQAIYNRIGTDEDAEAGSPSYDELRDMDGQAYRVVTDGTMAGWELRYQVIPFSEEFESPHKEGKFVFISPVMPDEEPDDEDIVGLNMSSAYEMPARGWYTSRGIQEAEEDEIDVVGYVAVAQRRGGLDPGWYMSVTIDDDHATHDLFVDEGPYRSALAAMRSGANEVIEWGLINDLEMRVPNLEHELEDWLNHRFDNWRDDSDEP